MSTINTLTEFLTQADTQFQLFDMGRQVRPLASDVFERIEQQQEPYPWPGHCSSTPGSAFISSSRQNPDTISGSSSLHSMSVACSSAAAPSSLWIKWSRPSATS